MITRHTNNQPQIRHRIYCSLIPSFFLIFFLLLSNSTTSLLLCSPSFLLISPPATLPLSHRWPLSRRRSLSWSHRRPFSLSLSLCSRNDLNGDEEKIWTCCSPGLKWIVHRRRQWQEVLVTDDDDGGYVNRGSGGEKDSGDVGCSDRHWEREERSIKKCPSYSVGISIMPLVFQGNYTITLDVVFMSVFLCSFIISLILIPFILFLAPPSPSVQNQIFFFFFLSFMLQLEQQHHNGHLLVSHSGGLPSSQIRSSVVSPSQQ